MTRDDIDKNIMYIRAAIQIHNLFYILYKNRIIYEPLLIFFESANRFISVICKADPLRVKKYYGTLNKE